MLADERNIRPFGFESDVQQVSHQRYRIAYGFIESPDVPAALALAREHGLVLEPDTTTFFLGRETLVPGHAPSLKGWRVSLYMWLAFHALSPARFYSLPPGRVVELGTQVAI